MRVCVCDDVVDTSTYDTCSITSNRKTMTMQHKMMRWATETHNQMSEWMNKTRDKHWTKTHALFGGEAWSVNKLTYNSRSFSARNATLCSRSLNESTNKKVSSRRWGREMRQWARQTDTATTTKTEEQREEMCAALSRVQCFHLAVFSSR